jgi:hypothetical protein
MRKVLTFFVALIFLPLLTFYPSLLFSQKTENDFKVFLCDEQRFCIGYMLPSGGPAKKRGPEAPESVAVGEKAKIEDVIYKVNNSGKWIKL